MTRVNIDGDLYERVRQAAALAGFSSADELIATAIENELRRLGEEQAEKIVGDQLRGLGYIE